MSQPRESTTSFVYPVTIHMLLALDTATRHSGIALYEGHQLIAELNWVSTDGQTTELMPRVTQLLAWQGLATSVLSAVAVGLGPGSFTGLRVALSAAKGMALAQGLPLLGIPTLDATTYLHLGRREPVCALVQAGRGQVCWAVYRPASMADPATGDGRFAVLGSWPVWHTPYRLTSVEALAEALEEPTFCVGELPLATRQRLQAAAGTRAILARPAVAVRRAGALAELGWARLQAGQIDDAASLSPIYLREP